MVEYAQMTDTQLILSALQKIAQEGIKDFELAKALGDRVIALEIVKHNCPMCLVGTRQPRVVDGHLAPQGVCLVCGEIS